MKFTNEKVLNLAKACKIKLSDSELILYKSNLEQITDFIESNFSQIDDSAICQNKAIVHGNQQNQILVNDNPISEPNKYELLEFKNTNNLTKLEKLEP